MPERLSARASAADALVTAALAEGADTRELQRLTGLAASSVGCTNAQISLLTDRQVSAAICGTHRHLRGMEAPFEETICAYALRSDSPIVVPDTWEDPRVSSLAAVAAGMVRAYLGVPLRLQGGEMVGVLCVYDDQPRDWTAEQLADLCSVGQLVIAELARLPPGKKEGMSIG